jgi:hypothetical protein
MNAIVTDRHPTTTADSGRGTGRVCTRTYEVSLPTGTATATIPQGYRADGGGEIARLYRLYPTMIGAVIIA